MTANQMADDLEIRLDRALSFGSPGYEDFELSRVLTQAEFMYVKKYISGLTNPKSYGFEETEARGQGFSALILDSGLLPVSADQTGTLENGTFFDLPEDFMFTILETADTDAVDCRAKDGSTLVAEVRVISHDEFNRFKRNVYKKPYANGYDATVFRMYFSPQINSLDPTVAATAKRHELITDGTFNVVDYRMRYLQNPPDIVVDRSNTDNQRNCILDEFTHDVIVDLARDLMLEIVKEQKLDAEIDIDNFE
tara:strand:+ start:19712 stop:20467 length:756 start_codon:yes stop_codon:yes gene_type:complete